MSIRLTTPLPGTSKPPLYPQKAALRMRKAAGTFSFPGPPTVAGPTGHRVLVPLLALASLPPYGHLGPYGTYTVLGN